MRRPPNKAWDFSPAIELLDSDWADFGTPTSLSAGRDAEWTPKPDVIETNTTEVTLGSFSKLFERLGISVDAPLDSPRPPEVEPELDSEAQTISDDAVQSSADEVADTVGGRDSLEDDIDHVIQNIVKAASFPDLDDPFVGITKRQRHRAPKQAEKICNDERQTLSRYEAQERARQVLQSRLDNPIQKQPNQDIIPKQLTARSNVGAKIKSTAPIHTVPKTPAPVELPAAPCSRPIPMAQQNHPIPITHSSSYHTGSVPHPSTRSVPAMSMATHTPMLLPPKALQYNPRPPTVLANLNSSLATQYTPAATNARYHHELPNGFITPVRGAANSYTPSTIPTENFRASANVRAPGPAPPLMVNKLFKKLAPRSREDRNFDFLKRLIDHYPEDKAWLVSPMRLSNEKSSSTGVHVFVDASNILIGFKEVLKRNRERSFDMSFDCLALLLERRRPVAKRVYAGSTRLAAPIASAEKFNNIAEAVGYEKNIYEQVYKVKEQTESQKFFKDVDKMGWIKATQRRSGSGSDSETGVPPSLPLAPKWVEQGVDESLHLKMCQSIIDVEVPTTMVLATGDGAAAEYSDGFLAHVERALKKGWKVELVSWRQQTSGSYKNKKFRAKWSDQFKIIELDDYLEWMIDA